MSGALHSAASVEHYTPLPIVEAARQTLGVIDLDPASCYFAQRSIRAGTYLDGSPSRDGLAADWYGRILLNPPGKSKGYPGGAAAWWCKLVTEYGKAPALTSAVFVGFSLEILQTCQTLTHVHPLHFPVCVPRKRLCFDVEADALAARIRAELASGSMIALAKMRKLEAKLKECEANAGGRVSGDSPTHGNVIVCVSNDLTVRDRFRFAFSAFGFVS